MAGTTKDFEELLDAFLLHDVRLVILSPHLALKNEILGPSEEAT